MGTNEKYEGMYADNDVAKDIALPTVQARKNYDDRQILNRLGQLGPLGLIHLWTEKLSILLDTSQIQDWYNGGFQSAPAWYQKRSYLFQKLTLITYAAATITLWLLLISRLVKWRPDLRQHQEVITFLAVMIALAYLAFHTILWETEPRYGQIILPLLLFITNALPQGQAVTEKKVHLRIYRRFWLQASLVGSSAAIFLIFSQHIQLDDNVVAAQQSQLSTQYKAKPTAIAPGTTLSEKIKLNKSADYIDVQVHANSTVTANLVDNQGNEVSRLTYSDGDYTSKEKIQPGSYRLVLTNQSSQNQLVDVVQTYNYQLSPYPLAINGTEYKDASLIFNVLLTEKR
ncbi:hypothetical protein FFIC_285650 [Fructobacillus ficulneus]|uniref:Uncharacterized protein n=1 Tax=Fructobacillus ficulneus TaxID=157463 RepID=A0A0K8MJ26_9LACO|nr:hypothetical protein FFIC_285650 [Fructobacillus ficulneus]